jgi:hypothetical protein
MVREIAMRRGIKKSSSAVVEDNWMCVLHKQAEAFDPSLDYFD